ncbi:MAG: hypothetical protein HGN29_17980 [Asgard group archaeon]|nr:hypothetical protein [Asgard group archaeon]
MEDLPLFLIQEEAIIIYVIDNGIVGCQPYHHRGYYGCSRSFNLLLELFRSSVTKKGVPQILHRCLSKIEVLPVHNDFNFVIGAKGYFGYPSLNFRVTINSDSEKPVKLHGFQLDTIQLTKELSLSPNEAFTIFANHCVNSRRMACMYNPKTKKSTCKQKYNLGEEEQALQVTLSALRKQKSLSEKEQKQKEENARQSFSQKFCLQNMNNFVSEYLNYVQKQLSEEENSPYDLLRLNGAGVITHFKKHPRIQDFLKDVMNQLLKITSLSLNKKIMYFTLMKLMDISWYIEKPTKQVEKFFINKEHILQKLESEIKKDFPEKSI